MSQKLCNENLEFKNIDSKVVFVCTEKSTGFHFVMSCEIRNCQTWHFKTKAKYKHRIYKLQSIFYQNFVVISIVECKYVEKFEVFFKREIEFVNWRMPSFCAVSNCELKYSHSENVSFHK